MSIEPEVAVTDSSTPEQPMNAKERRDRASRKTHPGPPKSVLREYFESAVVTVIMALFGITFVVQAVKVPTASMQNNIKVGDHLLINKFVFAPHHDAFGWLPYRDIRRGDIIVFKYPGDPTINFVKRVIGLPGEKIEIRGSKVFINDKLLPEQYTWATPTMDDRTELKPEPGRPPVIPPDEAYQEFYPNGKANRYMVYYKARGESDFASFGNDPDVDADSVEPCAFNEEALDANPEVRSGRGSIRFATDAPCVIQSGQYFAMGDNRDNSQDSRYWGTVPRENIIGRALIVYWSLDQSGMPREGEGEEAEAAPSSPFGRLFQSVKYFFTHTRWSDTGRLIR